MIVSMLVLFFGYITRLIKLSRKATSFIRKWLRIKYDLNTSFGSNNISSRLIHNLLETIDVCIHAYLKVFESTFWKVSHELLIFIIVLLTLKVLDYMAFARARMGINTIIPDLGFEW
jgi:hypothetical protein